MQQELTSYTAMAGLKVKTGGIGLSAQYAGSSSYNESTLGLGYGLRLGQVDIGARFSYTMMRAAGYGSDGAMAIEVGSIWHITNKVHTGLQVYHPAGSRFGKERQEQLSRLYKMGLGYEVSENLLLTTEIVKEEDKPASLQAGIQYVLDNHFFLRGGITTGTTMPWLGAGWGWKNIRADVVATYHPQLGVTPGLMLIFSGKKQDSQ